jgi:hypothetical protein
MVAMGIWAAGAQAQTFPDESQWLPLTRDGVPVGDVFGDAQGARDVVGDAANPAVYIYRDTTHLFFRERLDEDPVQSPGNYRPFGWGVLIEIDGNADNYEILALVDGISNPDVVVLAENTSPGTIGDPNDPAETVLSTYSRDTHSTSAEAPSAFGGTRDYFLSWAVDLADLAGVTASAPIQLIFGTSNNANSISPDLVGVEGTGNIADLISDPVLCTDAGCIPDGACLPGEDDDQDGVCLANDNCPDDFNPGQADLDQDGLGDVCDPDRDGDGLDNDVEIGLGTDPDNSDTDGDLLSDGAEVSGGMAPDSDSDGLTDPLDPDDDDDGLPTRNEVLDGLEHGNDVDGDGDENWLDTDSDADGIEDGLEGQTDGDGDGIPAYLDPDETTDVDADDDGDGLTNGQEALLGTDPQNPDSDGDGLTDAEEAPGGASVDTDGDGAINPLDPDDDGDGILTATEILDGNSEGQDPDGDGVDNHLDLDSDGDGIGDELEGRWDTDQDGSPNYLDLDADGDGADDATEGTDDADADGTPDFLDPVDDGPDVDADGDGLTNLEEAGLGSDAYLEDTDGDGLTDGEEVADGAEHGADVDADGNPNWLDLDSDGDGSPDEVEGRDTDSDGNGIPDYLDPDPRFGDDDDADGVINVLDNCPEKKNPDQEDQDGDGLGDVCDPDADGDGFADDLVAYGGGCACALEPPGDSTASTLLGLGLWLLWRRRGKRRRHESTAS